ncbi:MAG TPA: hypothetical protein PK322_09265 [Opitutaceae bacterium]|nr:hypothetical protein [Opitutaceae bacterium]
MQDRLAELRRQRALVAEHLVWLDREIAETEGKASPAPLPAPTPPPALTAAAVLAKAAEIPPAVAAGASDQPDAPLLPEPQPTDIKNDVRRGCLLYFALASLAVVAGTGLLVWAARSPWFREEVSPYFSKAAFILLVLALAAGIRGLVAKFRSR